MAGTSKYGTLDEQGREVLDDTPIVVHLRTGPVGDFDRIRQMIQDQLSAQARDQGMETLDEANDFDVDDDLFPVSPHEYAEGTEAADREALELARSRRAGAPHQGEDADDLGQPLSSRPAPSAAAPAVESSSEPPVQGGSAN